MKGERWIVVDTAIPRNGASCEGERYLGRSWWQDTVSAARPFDSHDEAVKARDEFVNGVIPAHRAAWDGDRLQIRRVRPSQLRAERDEARRELDEVRAAIATLIARASR